jgi:transcriptional regulator with XRE-family HTH domain
MNDEVPPPLGQRLRAFREKAGLTPSRLAHLVGVGEYAIRKVEKGESKEPSFTNGVRMADALGVSPHALAGLREPADLMVTLSDGTIVALTIKHAGTRNAAEIEVELATAIAAIGGQITATPPAAGALQSEPRLRDVMPDILDAIEGLRREALDVRERLEALENVPRVRKRAG